MAIKPIQILINAKDEASGVFDRLSGKVAAVAAAIAGYFGIKTFAGGVQGAADLESALSRVAAAADGGASEMAALRQAAEDAGTGTTYTSTQAAGALENLVKAGLSAKDAIGALPATMALAQAGDIELAQSAEIVTKAMAGMGLGVQDAARIADVLAKGANATNTSVEGLATAFSYVAPVAKASNISLESTVAILGKMADAGIDASRSGTALSNILAQFSDPASKFRTELAAIGITTSNFEQALSGLAAAGDKGEKAILAIGLNAGPGLRALLNQGMPALDALKKGLLDAEGAAAATARTMQDNLNGAMKGLGAVWGTVKNTLLTPVLPLLKDGVDQLTGALRGALSDGTVAKFGSAIATAFQGAIQWVKNFAASFDWQEVSARLQAFASDTQARLQQIGQWASNAGAAVQTAWGVMAGGTQTVLAVIYKVGEAFAGVVSRINDGAAWIAEKLSQITFGDVSKRFAAMAAEMRTEAGAFGAVADALAQKASEAFDAAAGHAQSARDGFASLGSAATAAASGIASATSDMVKSLAGVGQAATQAGEKTKAAFDQQAQATAAARAEVQRLRTEYDQAVATGNWQRAVELMGDLKRATDAAAGSAENLKRSAQDAAKELAGAFSRAGVQTKDELAAAARLAQNDFDLIKNSGQASADGIAQAFKRAADAAIAANNGIVPGWVQAQASTQGYEVAVDAAGKATLKAAEQAGNATGEMARGWHGVAGAAREATRAAGEYQDKLGEGVQRVGAGQFRNKDGWSSDAKGNVITAREDTALRNQRLAALFGEDMIGNANAEAAYNLKKRIDLLTANSFGEGDGTLGLLRKELERLIAAMEADRAKARAGSADASAPMGARGAGNGGTSSGVSYVSNITLDGRTSSLQFADRQSQQEAEALLRRLSQARGAAA